MMEPEWIRHKRVFGELKPTGRKDILHHDGRVLGAAAIYLGDGVTNSVADWPETAPCPDNRVSSIAPPVVSGLRGDGRERSGRSQEVRADTRGPDRTNSLGYR